MLITQRENLCLILIIIETKPQSESSESMRTFTFTFAHACRIFQENFPHFLSPNARLETFHAPRMRDNSTHISFFSATVARKKNFSKMITEWRTKQSVSRKPSIKSDAKSLGLAFMFLYHFKGKILVPNFIC